MVKEIKYFIYCRKSSEDSQKQVASIQDQTNALSKVVSQEKLNLVHKPFTEEKSSKDPGRPIFNEMLDRIQKGEANALLCWDIDRLYRNPVDEGRLRWMLQKGVIQVIRTPYRSFYPEDAGLLMGVEGGRATDYVIRLSKNVKRGLNSKAERGWRPSPAPIGYMNIGEVGNRIIVQDPDRFHLIRKMWDLFLTGTYSVSKIREIAINKWGLRTIQRRKLGGMPISMSHMYNIFSDPFYYGKFWWTNPETGEKELYEGKHPSMITEQEYKRAQILLGKKGKPQPKTKEFPFTGLMACGECGSAITAEEKNQIICSECKYKFSTNNYHSCPKCNTDISEMNNPTILHYVYYHCTKKKDKKCSQKYVKVENLEQQFNDILSKITIDKDYLELALEYLQDKQKNSTSTEKAIRGNLQLALDNCQTRINNIYREYASPQNADHGIYTPEEFKELKANLLKERSDLEGQISKAKNSLDQSLDITERIFNFCTFATHHFNTGDIQKKRQIFSTIGSNLTIKDRKLFIDKLHPFLLVENELKAQKELLIRLEPKESIVNKEEKTTFVASPPDWLRR